jgi:hypothetical protein
MTALRLASYAGVAAIALAVGQLPANRAAAQPAKQPVTTRPAAPAHAASGMDAKDCQAALDHLRALTREVGGWDKRVDAAQKALASAKGEARVDELVKVVNELADGATIIRRKEEIATRAMMGHMLGHIREAKSFDDLHQSLNHCVLVAHLERIANGAEDDLQDGTPPGHTPTPAAPKK